MGIDEKPTESKDFTAITDEEPGRRISLLIYLRDGVHVVPLISNGTMMMGRSDSADICIEESSLSRRHAMFELQDSEVWVEDLGSTNGTRVNGKKVTRRVVTPGDEILLGSVMVSIHVLAPMEGLHQGIYGHDQFLAMVQQDVTRARVFKRKVALIMVRAARGSTGSLSSWVTRTQRLLRAVDWMALYGPDTMEIALPETSQSEAEMVARSIVNDRQRGEPALVCGIAIFPDTATSSEELVEQCRAAVHRATASEPVQTCVSRRQGDWSSRQPADEAGDGSGSPVFRSQAMAEVFETVTRLSRSTIPVLIFGETGTGKEVVARSIHEGGSRKDQAMQVVNCGAIPDQLVESVLFGHERGAFTGASQRQKGIFEAADGGTVLLDEIGELPLPAQAALLRVLETKRVTRLGSNHEIEADARVLAATNRNLEAMCEAGAFRWDLLYRLNTMTLKVPPLRERMEEVAPLAEAFVIQANLHNERKIRGIDPAALTCLQKYSWPGNVRELRNVIERAVVIARRDQILVDDLPERMVALKVKSTRGKGWHTDELELFQECDNPGFQENDTTDVLSIPPPRDYRLKFKDQVQRFEAALISSALQSAGGNQTDAAGMLKIPLRTLVRKIKQSKKMDSDGTTVDPDLVNTDDPSVSFKARVQHFEATLIQRTLNRVGGNQSEAARRMKMPLRTLVHKLKTFGFNPR